MFHLHVNLFGPLLMIGIFLGGLKQQMISDDLSVINAYGDGKNKSTACNEELDGFIKFNVMKVNSTQYFGNEFNMANIKLTNKIKLDSITTTTPPQLLINIHRAHCKAEDGQCVIDWIRVCRHEAGHAFLHFFLQFIPALTKVWIGINNNGNVQELGGTEYVPKLNYTKKEMLDLLRLKFGHQQTRKKKMHTLAPNPEEMDCHLDDHGMIEVTELLKSTEKYVELTFRTIVCCLRSKIFEMADELMLRKSMNHQDVKKHFSGMLLQLEKLRNG